jgi:citrate/tricarballylate utilization protein
VFPAIELRRVITDRDIDYLANLCHDCGGCYSACQYTPPHEFAVNLPLALGDARAVAYETYAWPAWFARAFTASGTIIAVATVACIAAILAGARLRAGADVLTQAATAPGSFYRVIPERIMTATALVVVMLGVIATAMSGFRFWQNTGGGSISVGALRDGVRRALTLQNLGGDDQNDAFSNERRRWHHALFYGLLLCLASTTVAAIDDHVFGLVAPYALYSAPVLLGLVGGAGMMAGSTGLLWMKWRANEGRASLALRSGEFALLIQLFVAAATGLMLLAWRESAAMPMLLVIHLGAVLSFFITAPFSKFVHGMYRFMALVRSAREERESMDLASFDRPPSSRTR